MSEISLLTIADDSALAARSDQITGFLIFPASKQVFIADYLIDDISSGANQIRQMLQTREQFR